MLLAVALLSSMDALAKWLSTNGVTVVQLLALRSVILIPILIATFALKGQSKALKPASIRAHAARGFAGVAAPLCFFLGIAHIPLTDAVVVSFSSVFTITLLSIVFLGERVGLHRWGSIFLGFFGVLIVTNLQGNGSTTGYLLVIIASIAYAILFVSGKYLASTESVASLVLSYNLCVAIVSLACLPWFWNSLSPNDYLLVFTLALLSLGGQYLWTVACTLADASAIAAFEYTAVLWAVAFDFAVWHIAPSITTAIGATVIIASGLYLAHRERLQSLLDHEQSSSLDYS